MHSARTNKLAAMLIRGILVLAVPLAMPLIGARPAQAQTEILLHSFCPSGSNCTDGANPSGRLTSDGAGNFYGTTPNGVVWGAGTVFELSPNGSGGWNETVLHSFTGGRTGRVQHTLTCCSTTRETCTEQRPEVARMDTAWRSNLLPTEQPGRKLSCC